jgi:hypothetical protein
MVVPVYPGAKICVVVLLLVRYIPGKSKILGAK